MKETVRRENGIKGGKGSGEREGRIFRDGRRKTVSEGSMGPCT